MLMVTCMLENGETIKQMDMGSICIWMGQHTWETGQTIKKMVMEKKHGLMELFTKDSIETG